MTSDGFTLRTAALRALLAERLGSRGRTLGQALRRAGRQLPRRLRAEGRYLARAEQLASHPRLAAQIDQRRIDAALAEMDAFLRRIDPKERRMTRLLGLLANIAASLLVVAALVVAVLVWRGYL